MGVVVVCVCVWRKQLIHLFRWFLAALNALAPLSAGPPIFREPLPLLETFCSAIVSVLPVQRKCSDSGSVLAAGAVALSGPLFYIDT